MLSALLPGVREFRTPLVTGLLWAASLWLLIGSSIAESQATTKFVDGLGLAELPPGVWLGAVALLAYLVGSLMVVRASPFGDRGPRIQYWLERMLDRLDEDRAPEHLRHRILWRVWRMTVRGLPARVVHGWVRSGDPNVKIDYWLRNEFQAEIEKGQVPVMRSFLGGCMTPTGFEGFCDATTLTDDGTVPSIYEGGTSIEMLTEAFVREVKGEKAEVEVRIEMRHPHLYAEIDRLKVEGEFRLSIFWPLMVLVVVLGYVWSPLVLALIVVPPLLVRDGFRRISEASEKSWGALMAREVTSPTLDVIEQAREQGKRFDFGERYPSLVRGDNAEQLDAVG